MLREKKRNKTKIVLSLLIAMAFLLPATSAFVGTTNVNSVEEVDASDEQKSVKNAEGINFINLESRNGLQPQSQGAPLAPLVTITGISLLPKMATGDHDIVVTLAHNGAGPPDCCDIKLFCDVFKLDPLPLEEMYCTDFEDMADIMNNWDSVNVDVGPIVPGSAVDTFTLSDARANSGTYSFKNTQFPTYMGNQEDWLETKITNPDGGKYEDITVTFMHWMDGELVDGGGAGDIPEDYGQIQYSINHVNWFTVPTWEWIDEPAEIGVFNPQVYTSTDGWEEVTGEFGGMTGVSEFWLRFYWLSGPTIQNEGWYVDDVCVSGTYSPHPDFLFQTHSLGPVTVCNPPLPGTVDYTFPTTWHAEEGTYHFEIWMLDDTVAGPCDVEYPQSFKYLFDCEIGDFIELAILSNSYPGGPIFDMGDDLLVTSSVTNLGTVDASNVPMTMSVAPQIVTNHMLDYVEGTYYDPDTYDPYSDEAHDEGGIWEAHDFGPAGGAWHCTDMVNFVSPTHAWKGGAGDIGYGAGHRDAIVLSTEDLGVNLADYMEAIEFDLIFQLNYDLAVGDMVCGLVQLGNNWITLSSSGMTGSTGGFIPASFSDITSMYFAPGDNLPMMLDWLAGAVLGPSGDINDVTGFGIQLTGVVWGDSTIGQTPGGCEFDNIKLYSVVAGAEVYSQTLVIPLLECETITDPAEIETLDFEWLNMPTGDYIEETSVPLDDPNPFKPINFDNQMQGPPFSVITDITAVDPIEVEHMDLYEPEDVSQWHITTSGYDQYLWCGEEDTGVYRENTDDLVYFVSDDNTAHDECPISMDWSDTTQVTLSFDEYIDSPDGGFDFGYIEVNPHVSEPGSRWYYHTRILTGDVWDWTHFDITMDMVDFFNDYIGAPLSAVEPTAPTYTDDMGVRLRWTSDGDWQFRGWLLDNIEITYFGGDKYEENLCDDMDRFIADVPYPGDFWFEEPDPVATGWTQGWTCLDRNVFAMFAVMALPPDLNNALVWDTSVPQATSAKLWFDYDCNLNVGEDFCYLEFSTDGGNLWIAPVAFTGASAGTYQFDMSAFTGDNVLIRWRIISDDQNIFDTPRYFHVENMAITGQVDLNPPVTTASISGTMIHGYYNTPVTFTATATDDISGVAAIKYKIDGGAELTYTSPVSIGVSGDHYVEYWAIDNVGNEEVHRVTATFSIDTGDGPTVTITAPTPGLYFMGNQILSIAKTYIIGPFTIEATATDVGSGIASVEFFLDGASIGSDISSPYSIYCAAKHMGAASIKAVATDYADNQGQATFDIDGYFKFL